MLTREPFNLPEMSFTGGETQELSFNCFHPVKKLPLNLRRCQAEFCVSMYGYRTEQPLVRKTMDVCPGDTGELNVLNVTLPAGDTVGLYGRFIYQLSVREPGGRVAIPGQGIMYIVNNVDKAFVG